MYFLFFKFLVIFLERGEGKETGRETSMCERNMDQLPLTAPNWGSNPQPRHVPDPLVCSLVLNPLSHTSQG